MNKPGYFLSLLNIDIEKYPVIAVVGGGGKTSLIFRLTSELVEMGKKVIISTTTHMSYEPDRPFALNGDKEEVKSQLEQNGYVLAASLDKTTGKIGALQDDILKGLMDYCDVMLIEADGAKRKPLKVPEKWEPVIPDFADAVISVVGLDCLGKPICEVTHRMELISEFLQKQLNAPVTQDDIVKIASSVYGLYKSVNHRVYRVYLNKSDVLPNKEEADKIVEKLEKVGKTAVYGSLKEDISS